jgi:hypothetical protein
MDVEAHQLPSKFRLDGDSHTYVVTRDKTNIVQWTNKGRGWYAGYPGDIAATNTAYKEWLLEFVPPNNLDKCGIIFGLNGVCHTYANRELLVGSGSADVRTAPKDYASVFFFGKYGMGVRQIKTLLRDSYKKVMVSYSDPYSAFSTVMPKVDNILDDELYAWRQMAIDYGKIPVDDILAKNPAAGCAVARTRLQAFITEREYAYQQYINSGRAMGDAAFRQQLIVKILKHAGDYLDFLVGIRYVSKSDRDVYMNNIRNFLNLLKSTVEEQIQALVANGELVLLAGGNVAMAEEGRS